ncbi:hypothetical protein TSUD_267220 [Trifolium subterraneum]|uniref:Uncharacterized protein n=1 Tax=Trifolium subterraneum TaxID=3900 RepID=A0A2Z6N1B5_TRISU|nr:hypothetical protein TSUD_267220 [Trifolium subterraneum]
MRLFGNTIQVLKANNVDVKIIARRTARFFGADFANLVNVAAMDSAKAASMHGFDYALKRTFGK